MTSVNSALGFSTSDKAQFRFHCVALLSKSGWGTVSEAFPNLSRPTVYRWKKTYESSLKRLNSLVPKSTKPKTTRRMQTPVSVLSLIKSLRKQYPRMGKAKIKLFVDQFCESQKIKALSESTIGKVIKRNNFFFAGKQVGKRRGEIEAKKRIKLCPSLKETEPGYLQVDGVKFYYCQSYYYFLTAVEIVSRQAFVKLIPNMSSKQAASFITEVLNASRIKIHTVQTDNGSEFKLLFDQALQKLGLTHLFSYPRRPKTNGFVERFNWTIQDEFLSSYEDLLLNAVEFQKELSEWMVYYNQIRPHQGLNYLTPYQYQEKEGLCLKSV